MTSPQRYPQPVQPVAYRNGFGITALVLMLVGAVFTLMPITGFLAVILGGLAVVFGLLGWGRTRRGEANNQTMSVLSTIFGAIVFAGGIFGVVLFFQAFDELDDAINDFNSSAPALSGPAQSAAGAPVDEYSESDEPAAPMPAQDQFTVDMKLTSQQCYGYGAGCNVMAEPDVTYTGAESDFDSYTCDITYEVTGDEFGKQLETATISSGGNVNFIPSVLATASKDVTPTSEVTSVDCY